MRDMDVTLSTTMVTDANHVFADFAAALRDQIGTIPIWESVFRVIRERRCIQEHGFGLFLLPVTFPEASLKLVAVLHNRLGKLDGVGGILAHIPWAGPLGHLTLDDVMPPPGSYTLLVATGVDRVAHWAKTKTHKEFYTRTLGLLPSHTLTGIL
jgi:hypothetical protein